MTNEHNSDQQTDAAEANADSGKAKSVPPDLKDIKGKNSTRVGIDPRERFA